MTKSRRVRRSWMRARQGTESRRVVEDARVNQISRTRNPRWAGMRVECGGSLGGSSEIVRRWKFSILAQADRHHKLRGEPTFAQSRQRRVLSGRARQSHADFGGEFQPWAGVFCRGDESAAGRSTCRQQEQRCRRGASAILTAGAHACGRNWQTHIPGGRSVGSTASRLSKVRSIGWDYRQRLGSPRSTPARIFVERASELAQLRARTGCGGECEPVRRLKEGASWRLTTITPGVSAAAARPGGGPSSGTGRPPGRFSTMTPPAAKTLAAGGGTTGGGGIAGARRIVPVTPGPLQHADAAVRRPTSG